MGDSIQPTALFGRHPPWALIAFVLLLAAICLSLCVGAVFISPFEILSRLTKSFLGDATDDATHRILFAIRLPRVCLAVLVGAALSLAGLASQTLFRNPLATPTIIGVSNGAALGAVVMMLLVGKSRSSLSQMIIPAGVLSGLVVTMIVYLLAQRTSHLKHTLLLAGIAIATLCSSLTAVVLYLAGERLAEIVFWLMGGLWRASWKDVMVLFPVCLIGMIGMLILAKDMNLFLLGDQEARNLGQNVNAVRRWLLFLIAILVSVAVSLAGVIGFLGLIVPHILRLIVGPDHRTLVLPTALCGGALLVTADTLARALAAPVEIPVGIFTAVLGASTLLWLLLRRSSHSLP